MFCESLVFFFLSGILDIKERVVKPLSFCNKDSGLKMSNPHAREIIIGIVNDVAADLEFLIYDANIYLKGENTRIIVKIDHLEGISHDDCAEFSRELSRRLDGAAVLPNYAIEISSPGLNRQLRNAGEFARFRGFPVKIIYEENEGERKVVKGLIEDVRDDVITVVENEGKIELRFIGIKSAQLEFKG